MTPIIPDPARFSLLADTFVNVIREWATESEFEEIKKRNGTKYKGDPLVCATHDFFDANMAMDEAFRAAFGKGPLDEVEVMSDADIALWNAAWDQAKIGKLTT